MIFVTFTILVALLLLTLIFTRLPWVLKTGLIAAVFAFCFLVWAAQDSRQGWPAPRPFPNNAQFISCVTVEPDTSHGIEGAIYLWVIPLSSDHGVFAYRGTMYEPRAYQEPYDENLQAACQQARKASAGGQPVRIVRRGHNKRHGNVAAAGAVSDPGRYRVYRLPPVLPPVKHH